MIANVRKKGEIDVAVWMVGKKVVILHISNSFLSDDTLWAYRPPEIFFLDIPAGVFLEEKSSIFPPCWILRIPLQKSL